MSNVYVDVLNTINLFDGYMQSNYNLLFSSSNEYLKDVFSKYNFKGKKVLSVMGSGDQAFHFFNNNVGELDLFDINKLTLYNFYLRYWNMRFNNLYYLPEDLSKEFIYNLLYFVEPTCIYEEESQDYWKLLIQKCNDNQLNKLYIPKATLMKSDNSIDHKWKIVNNIKNNNYNFYNIDISKELYIDKKYDYIYVSNIGDYVSKNKKSFIEYRNNLCSLLENNGTIICTNVIKDGANNIEKEVFGELFDCFDMPRVINDYSYKSEVPGYLYKRKVKR